MAKRYQITLDFTKDEVQKFLRMVMMMKMTGHLNPDVNPVDATLVKIVKQLKIVGF
jgi:hypothetical protein